MLELDVDAAQLVTGRLMFFISMSTAMIEDPAVRTRPTTDRARLIGLVGPVIIAAVAFVLTAGVWEWVGTAMHARPAVPEPFKTKIDLFLNGPKYDTVFIGSSRFFHGIDPAVFDAQTAKLGSPTHSFNLGFDALDFPELRFVVENVLNDPRSHLKNLVVEASLRVRLAPGLEHSQRAVTLHDAKGSQYVAEFILNGNHDWRRKLFWLYEQGWVSAVRLTNTGVFTNRYIHPQEPPQEIADLMGRGDSGYYALTIRNPDAPVVTERGIQQLVTDQKYDELTGQGRRLNAYEISQLTSLQSEAAAHDVKLILLALPTASAEIFGEFSAFGLAQRDGSLTVPMMSFTDPVAYFDLYDPADFYDPDHLRKNASERLTLKAADAFVDMRKAQR